MKSELRKSEKGNALFYVLIAVVLLAALTYAVSQSGRGNTGRIDEERARLAAADMLEYANTIAQAVSQLRLRGCRVDELSFEGATGTYNNTDAPGDNSCHIFEINGGGVNFQELPEGAQGTAASWVFSGDMEINEVGTTCGNAGCVELLMIGADINDATCSELNRMSGITDPVTIPSQDDATYNAFTGGFAYEDTVGDQASSARLSGKSAGCFTSDNDNINIFYRVLQAR